MPAATDSMGEDLSAGRVPPHPPPGLQSEHAADAGAGAEATNSGAVFVDGKTSSILAASQARDISRLKELAVSQGGYLTDDNRCHACGFLTLTPLSLHAGETENVLL